MAADSSTYLMRNTDGLLRQPQLERSAIQEVIRSGTNVVDNRIIYTIVGAVGFALLLSISRRREYYAYRLKLILRMEAAYIIAVFIAAALGRQQLEPILWGLLAGFVVYIRTKPRSRHISAAVRRKKEAEHVLRTGKKFDRKKHELDHEVPFSSGGGHSEANLRVVGKGKNRSKGAKSPWWDLLGG
jgi:5-methylcytosine-specific restriction endonuclease McrA